VRGKRTIITRSTWTLNARRAQNVARQTSTMTSFTTIKPCQLHSLDRQPLESASKASITLIITVSVSGVMVAMRRQIPQKHESLV